MTIEVTLPELGDDIDSADILNVLVSEGDVIEKDQDIVEIETDKATAEVPSKHAGKVVKIHVSTGDSVAVGAALITLEAVVEPATEPAAPPAAAKPIKPPAPKAVNLPGEKVTQPPAPPTIAPIPAPAAEPVDRTSTATPSPKTSSAAGDVAAGPAIRRLAREVGVDLRLVTGSGSLGRITRDDVLAVVRKASQAAPTTSEADDRETDGFGPVRFLRMTKIHKTIAAKMHESWTSAPRVTNFDDADVTELEGFRQGSKADYAARGIKLTSMPFLIKAVAMSLRGHPLINAALDAENERIILKDYINIGIAVDTERGLIVPTLRRVDEKSISDIAADLKTLTDNARDSKFSMDDLRGGTFTISNLGAIGGSYSTPIINVPEVAILLVGRSRKLPVVVDDQIQIRTMMPLSLSYDHRVVDGATAARFLNEVIGYLKAPSRLLLAS
jgi:pyruvate/2-oxoglutarate dehydrogenase complex dihydrolipoamide acyltransferase (E2) component